MTRPILSSIKALMIDMDGVLWRGETILPGFHDFFQHIHDNHIPFMLVTNNARKTQMQYVQRLAGYGVTIHPEQVMTAAVATSEYLKQTYPSGSRFYVIGEDGVKQAVREAGHDLDDKDVQGVVVGLDFDINYQKLKTATLCINAGADFIGTNPDVTFPVENGVGPGNGAIIASVAAATGQTPVIVGKPERIMFEVALGQLGTQAAETAMIGDRLGTDILGARRVGMKTILLLSGISTAEDVEASETKPDLIYSGIADLVVDWREI